MVSRSADFVSSLVRLSGRTFFVLQTLLHHCCDNDCQTMFDRPQVPFLRYNSHSLCNGESGMSHPALTQLRALRYLTTYPR